MKCRILSMDFVWEKKSDGLDEFRFPGLNSVSILFPIRISRPGRETFFSKKKKK